MINIKRWRVKKVEIRHNLQKDSFSIYRSNYSDETYKFIDLQIIQRASDIGIIFKGISEEAFKHNNLYILDIKHEIKNSQL